MSDPKSKDSHIVCQTSQGAELAGALRKFTRFSVAFELYNSGVVLLASEVLYDFKIIVSGRTIYSGRAVVRSAIDTGPAVITCDATLSEGSWTDVNLAALNGKLAGRLSEDYRSFLTEWKKVYQVLPDFKVVVADMQTYLADLRLWLDQVELGLRGCSPEEFIEAEKRAVKQLGEVIVPTFNVMHERLEMISSQVEEELRPVHQSFSKRQLHPLVLCSPFAHRTFHKPLGYAGDYEMVNMIARDPFEGGSLFAKVVNYWFLRQWPAEAHRNRLIYLADCLEKETLRVLSADRRQCRVMNFACGPACETQRFLRQSHLSDGVDMTLMDFNGETIERTGRVLAGLRLQYKRRAVINFEKKSVLQVLKDRQKSGGEINPAREKYDFIYCAGLFDYLPDRTCKQMTEAFYEQLAPGGLLVLTVVDDYKPFRHMLEFVLDWHLIYRDAKRVAAVIPDNVPHDVRRMVKDTTGVNVFVELRKPDDA